MKPPSAFLLHAGAWTYVPIVFELVVSGCCDPRIAAASGEEGGQPCSFGGVDSSFCFTLPGALARRTGRGWQERPFRRHCNARIFPMKRFVFGCAAALGVAVPRVRVRSTRTRTRAPPLATLHGTLSKMRNQARSPYVEHERGARGSGVAQRHVRGGRAVPRRRGSARSADLPVGLHHRVLCAPSRGRNEHRVQRSDPLGLRAGCGRSAVARVLDAESRRWRRSRRIPAATDAARSRDEPHLGARVAVRRRNRRCVSRRQPQRQARSRSRRRVCVRGPDHPRPTKTVRSSTCRGPVLQRLAPLPYPAACPFRHLRISLLASADGRVSPLPESPARRATPGQQPSVPLLASPGCGVRAPRPNGSPSIRRLPPSPSPRTPRSHP